MEEVRIMILKTMLDKDLAKECGVEHLGACPLMEQGQVLYVNYAKLGGFCDKARRAICQYVFALAHDAGSDVFYYGGWIKILGVAVYNYNDGLWSVAMKLEATEGMAQ